MRFDDYTLPISTDYKPVHAKPYHVPRSLEENARELIQHLISIDVLEKIYDSEMVSPAFFSEETQRFTASTDRLSWAQPIFAAQPILRPTYSRDFITSRGSEVSFYAGCKHGVLRASFRYVKP